MRKVTFIIDDEKFFREDFKHNNPELTEKQIDDIVSDMLSFKAILTLYGSGKSFNKYELTDHNGVKMSMRDLNGYQHGIIINDCYSYFEGRPYQNKADKPCGVIQIIDEEV